MHNTDVQQVAVALISMHGKGASLLAYQHVVRTMALRDRTAAENWCRVLLAVEEELTRA